VPARSCVKWPVLVVVAACSAAPPPRQPEPLRASAEVPREPAAFELRRGRPADVYRAYSIERSGPNGPATFTSAATVRPGHGFALLDVGRYAIVDLPDRDAFFVRDVGANGWLTELEMHGTWIVARYAVRDGSGDADTAVIRSTGKMPAIVHADLHEIVEVWAFELGGAPRVVFAHEYGAWAECCGSELGPAPPRVEDDVDIADQTITLRARPAWRARAGEFVDAPKGVARAIAPWDAPSAQTFRLD
jgi:hypothetical protein